MSSLWIVIFGSFQFHKTTKKYRTTIITTVHEIFVRYSSLYIISFIPQEFNFSQFLSSYILIYSLYNDFISSTCYTGSNGTE